MVLHGTFNTTYGLRFDRKHDSWDVIFSDNAISEYIACSPTGVPTGQPTNLPSGSPTGQPSMKPSGQPTCQPSGQPTGQPTLNATGLIVFERANYGDSWMGVELLIEDPDRNIQASSPSALSNPLDFDYMSLLSGIYILSAYFPGSTPSEYSRHDLECVVSICSCLW